MLGCYLLCAEVDGAWGKMRLLRKGSYRKEEIHVSGGDYYVLLPQIVLFSLINEEPRGRSIYRQVWPFLSNPSTIYSDC